MGLFSFTTGDTGESILVDGAEAPKNKFFDIWMICEDGTKYYQAAGTYEGYGEFGDKDIFELIAELNDCGSDRDRGIELVFKNNPSGSLGIAAARGVKVPKFTRNKNATWHQVGFSEQCPNQGFFF